MYTKRRLSTGRYQRPGEEEEEEGGSQGEIYLPGEEALPKLSLLAST